jgi:hypothetical protein
MTLNPEQFRNPDPHQEANTHKHWLDAISGKGSYVTMSASDALDMTSSEAPRTIVKGEYARTDWNKLESGETSINDFVQLRHAPRIHQVKLERAKWGEPDSLYRDIQKHGLDKSNALWAMRNPYKPNQVMLTEGHHRLIAAHAIDPDMPVHVLDEGTQHSGAAIRDRFNLMNEVRSTQDEHLHQFLADPTIMQKNPKTPQGNIKGGAENRKIDEIQKTVKMYSLDKENIKPAFEGSWKKNPNK